MAKRQIALTTSDNPFDPFVQFDDWDAYDRQMGYHSCAYLARIAHVGEDATEADELTAIEDAIDEIVRLNLIGIYKKVERIVEE